MKGRKGSIPAWSWPAAPHPGDRDNPDILIQIGDTATAPPRMPFGLQGYDVSGGAYVLLIALLTRPPS